MPYTGGSGIPITSYHILIKKADGSLVTFLPNCDGNSTIVVNNRYCFIPMSSITGTTFGLVQGDLIQAQIAATNARGQGDYSNLNTEGARARVVPHTPTEAPTRGSLTSDS